MPLFPPNTAYGRLGGAWRTWQTPWIHRSGSWEQPERVWVYSAGSWRIVWAATATAALNPVATINGTAVDVTFDAPAGTTDDPEAATSYNVRRSDGSLVGSVTAVGGSYLVTDSLPLVGTHAYTVWSLIHGVEYTSAVTNTVTLGVVPGTPTATTSNVGTDTNVTVVYGIAPGAVAYNIYNVNGTFAGQPNPVNNTVFTDFNPVAGVGGYSVEAVLANGHPGPMNESNSLTLAQAPSSLVAAAPVNGDDVALTWSVAGVGDHDQIQVVRGGSSLVYLAAGATSYTDTNAREGTVESYKVRAVISGNHGPYSNQATSAIPANVPTSVSIAATGTLGQLKLTWGNPAGSRTGYQVQRNDGSWGNVGDNTSPSYYTWAAGTGTRQMRVRTTSAGGASAYVTKTGTPLWDNTPPADATVTSFKPESSYGRLVVRFTTSSSDNYEYLVEKNASPGSTPWSLVSGWNSTGNSQTKSHVVQTGTSGQTWWVRVQVRDQYGNTSIGSEYYYTLKPQLQSVFATTMGHWRQGVWGYDWANAGRAYQGYFTNPAYLYYGFWWYAPNAFVNATNATSSFGGKVTSTTWNVSFWREGGGNAVQDALIIGSHTTPSYPGTGNTTIGLGGIDNVYTWGTLNYGEGKIFNLSNSIRDALSNGSRYGLATNTQKPYMFMIPLASQSSNGRVDVWTLG